MLQEIIAVLYISWLCWSAGRIAFSAFASLSRTAVPKFSFSVVCFTGLALIAIPGSIFSLFVPLGSGWIQALFAGSCVGYWLYDRSLREKVWLHIKTSRKKLIVPVFLLTVVMIGLILIMGVYQIIHPDTLAYHAQIIQWIQQFRVVPGLAHIHIRYGLQNNWFLLCALFSFPFTSTTSLTFINSTVAIWFVLFIAERIREVLTAQSGSGDRDYRPAVISFVLLVMAFWDFGQLRLTAVSASPDFVAGLCVWLVFYLLLKDRPALVQQLLAVVAGIFAVTIKLSCAPVLLPCCFVAVRFARHRQYRLLALSGGLTVCILVPFLIRNFVTTGYPLFPSVFPDVLPADWKVDQQRLRQVVSYISSYGKIGDRSNLGQEPPEMVHHVKEWLPVWWQLRPVAEKGEMILLMLGLAAALWRVRQLLQLESPAQRVLLSTSICGVLFWFVQAPDPRFGYGFILATPGILFYLLTSEETFNRRWVKRMIVSGVVVFTVCAGSYTVYRLAHFFAPRNLLSADGLQQCRYEKTSYQGFPLFVPEKGCACGGTPLPCADVAPVYLLRGPSLADGFKARPPAVLQKQAP